jgi:hypothetical protein
MDLASRYVLVGLIWLVAAMIQGVWMGLTGAMQYLTLHVGMVLNGGVMGIAFGLVLRAWRNVAANRWTRMQFLLWNFGVLGQALGAILRAWGWGDAVIGAASLVVLAAGVLMLAVFYRDARGDDPVRSAGHVPG